MHRKIRFSFSTINGFDHKDDRASDKLPKTDVKVKKIAESNSANLKLYKYATNLLIFGSKSCVYP